MSSTVLMVKLVKKNENDEVFDRRRKMYKTAINKHNRMVFNTIPNTDERHNFVGLEYDNIKYFKDFVVTRFEESYLRQECNPYFDSGFDIFQPVGKMHSIATPAGETKSYELEIGTHLVGLGIKAAMYTIPLFKSNNLNAELLRRITIYDNIENLVNENNDISKINMVRRMNWSNCQTPMPYKLHPRSSIYKKAIRQANCTGIIDSGYRGELGAAVDCLGYNYGKQTDPIRTTLEYGNRYFQICRADLQPFYVLLLNSNDDLPSTVRGEGGFGSTGR